MRPKRFWRPKVTKAVDLQAAMMPKVTLRRRRRAHSRLRSYVRLLVLIVQSQQSDHRENKVLEAASRALASFVD